MGRAATGSVYQSRGRWYAVFTIAGKRVHFALHVGVDEHHAKQRQTQMARALHRLRRSAASPSIVEALLKEVAASSPALLGDVLRLVGGVIDGKEEPSPVHVSPTAPQMTRLASDLTLEQFGRLWTSGKLNAMFPAHVKAIDQEDNAQRLEKHVYPLVGTVRMRDFTLDHADFVLNAATLPRGSVRHAALIIHRLVVLAVYPGRLLQSNPLPRGWLPKPPKQKAMSFLYPEEDATLLGTSTVPLVMRVFIGLCMREGLRKDEAASLEWKDLDLTHGTVDLDQNKTDDPRTWALDDGTAEALRRWRQTCPSTRWVFPAEALSGARRRNKPLAVGALARQLRAYLIEAGVRRDVLFQSDATRQRLRAHDLRASFITVQLALGKSETWIQDRTGHTSSVMINRYRRRARLAEQLRLGPFKPLHVAIPELRDAVVIELRKTRS